MLVRIIPNEFTVKPSMNTSTRFYYNLDRSMTSASITCVQIFLGITDIDRYMNDLNHKCLVVEYNHIDNCWESSLLHISVVDSHLLKSPFACFKMVFKEKFFNMFGKKSKHEILNTFNSYNWVTRNVSSSKKEEYKHTGYLDKELSSFKTVSKRCIPTDFLASNISFNKSYVFDLKLLSGHQFVLLEILFGKKSMHEFTKMKKGFINFIPSKSIGSFDITCSDKDIPDVCHFDSLGDLLVTLFSNDFRNSYHKCVSLLNNGSKIELIEELISISKHAWECMVVEKSASLSYGTSSGLWISENKTSLRSNDIIDLLKEYPLTPEQVKEMCRASHKPAPRRKVINPIKEVKRNGI